MIGEPGQLHLVTGAGFDPAAIVPKINAAVRAGVDVVQVRNPHAATRELFEAVTVISSELSRTDARIVVNDRVDVALAAGADGVHLGQHSLDVRTVRQLAGAELLIGVSVHDVEEARSAAAEGADYLTFGHVYPTPSHPGDEPRGAQQLKTVVQAVDPIPVIAIGGITAGRVPEVLDAGASGVAVIRAILGADDVALATRELVHAIQRHFITNSQEDYHEDRAQS